MDTKTSAIQLLEAVAELLARGHAPRRTILLAFGHDEELGGVSLQGACPAMCVCVHMCQHTILLAFRHDEELGWVSERLPGA